MAMSILHLLHYILQYLHPSRSILSVLVHLTNHRPAHMAMKLKKEFIVCRYVYREEVPLQ